jgi:hypothetical protein
VTAEKVEIVESNAKTYVLNVALDVIGLPASSQILIGQDRCTRPLR